MSDKFDKIAIMQPTFLPWLGYFKMIESVDCFVFLDCVQFERRSWQSRNKIKLDNKEHFVNLCTKKMPQDTLLKDIILDKNEKWKHKLLNTFHHAYSKSVNFKVYYELLKYALFSFVKLTDINIFLIKRFCEDLNIKTPLIKTSSLNVTGKRERLLLEICKNLQAKQYLSPEGSKNYLQKDEAIQIFKDQNIEILYFDDFIHPFYKQQGKDFIEYLSTIDFLFNANNPKNFFKGENESTF